MKNPLENLDYRIECDDFFVYELGRLVEEGRASFDDEEFRRLMDAGIHEHVERRLEIRTEIAARFRKLRSAPVRELQFVEDIEAPLHDVPTIIQSTRLTSSADSSNVRMRNPMRKSELPRISCWNLPKTVQLRNELWRL